MKIIVCDDNPSELNEIVSVLKKCNYSESFSLHCFDEPWETMNFFDDGINADILFLDIIMPKLSGIELAHELRSAGFKGHIVFISSSNDYAAQSYEVRAISYLIKPIKTEDVQKILDKIKRGKIDLSGFKLTWKGGGQFILFSELIYTEIQNHHLFFNLNDGEVIKIYGKMSDYSDLLLSDPRMVYINRSFIINMDYINGFESKAVFLKNNTRISIPRGYEKFQKGYFNWMFKKRN